MTDVITPTKLTSYKHQLVTKQHRSTIFLEGSFQWLSSWLSRVECLDVSAIDLVFSDQTLPFESLSYKNYRHHLGTENRTLLFADRGFNLDALSALSGTVVAGGTCYIWLPDTQSFTNSHFYRYLKRHIASHDDVLLINEKDTDEKDTDEKGTDEAGAGESDLIELAADDIPSSEMVVADAKKSGCSEKSSALGGDWLKVDGATQEQQDAISTIVKSLEKPAQRSSVVLTADRGRGKSSTLALALSKLLIASEVPIRVVVSAPHRMALGVFFTALAERLSDAVRQSDCFFWRDHQIEFVPIDGIVREQPKADLLIIDEAAGIPVYLLDKLSEHYAKLLFASTIYGYEGAGKGFTNKFLPLLKRRFKKLTQLHINQPIRWAQNDPLEQFLFDTCLLDAELPELTGVAAIENVIYQTLSGQALADNDKLLKPLLAILVTAHYQTKPSDLKLLLDDSAISVIAQFSGEQLIGVALLAEEGIQDEELAQGVLNGQRRVKGHMVPQALSQQLQIASAISLRYCRVMRIAIHPELQGHGYGTALLEQVKRHAAYFAYDAVATSFAASFSVTNFWLTSGFLPVKLGFSPDASSGEHSLLLLKPLSAKATALSEFSASEFYDAFCMWLSDEFKSLDYRLVALLLASTPTKFRQELTERQHQKLAAFTQNASLYSMARDAISLWLRIRINTENIEPLLPLIAKALMLKTDKQVCQDFGISGKKALYQHFQCLIKDTND